MSDSLPTERDRSPNPTFIVTTSGGLPTAVAESYDEVSDRFRQAVETNDPVIGVTVNNGGGEGHYRRLFATAHIVLIGDTTWHKETINAR